MLFFRKFLFSDSLLPLLRLASGGLLVQLDRRSSRTCTMNAASPFLCLRRPACSAGPKQVTDLHHGCGFAVPLPPAASLFSWTEAGHGPAPWMRLRRSSASGGQLIQLDRSRSQTCTMNAAPPLALNVSRQNRPMFQKKIPNIVNRKINRISSRFRTQRPRRSGRLPHCHAGSLHPQRGIRQTITG